MATPIRCKSCNIALNEDALDNGIDCPECGEWFCDNCYDTTKGDGCYCHIGLDIKSEDE